MSGEIQLAIASARALIDLVGGARATVDQHKLALATQELNQRLLAAQDAMFALQERNAALSKRVRDLEEQERKVSDWEAESKKYKLTEIAPGVFLMAPQKAMYDPQGAVKLCHRCYQGKKQSILQEEPDPERLIRLHCHECGQTLRFQKYRF